MSVAIYEIAKRLRGHKSGTGWMCHCPVHDDRSPSLSIDYGANGKLLVWCFAGCDPLDVLHALGTIDDLHVDRAEMPRSTAKRYQDMLPFIRDTWKQCMPASGTPVEAYLRARGYDQPIPATVRYHPALRHSRTKQYLDAMVSAIAIAPGRQVIAIHRTYLLPGGAGKSPVEPNRMMLGRVAGGAVRLSPAAQTIAIAEGIETALSVQQGSGIATWAALSAPGIENLILPPLPLAAHIVIAADNDASGAGLKAAHTAAERWSLEGRAIRITMPPQAGMDFNDLLRGGNHV